MSVRREDTGKRPASRGRENLQGALEELEALCEKLGIRVVHAELSGEGMSTGGLCKVKGEWRAIVDKRAPTGERVSVLARALREFDLEGLYVSPKVRELIGQR